MKTIGTVLSVLVTLLLTSSSRGQYAGCQHCQGMTAAQLYASGYHMNCQWPSLYIPPARSAINSAYCAMIANGWRRQNLLGEYHFEKDSNQLTTAGKLKAKWILTQAPQDRRNVFVERGATQEETDARIAAVHDWAASQSPTLDSVNVNGTHIVSEGHPAGAVDNIFVGFQTNQPPPVLSSENASSSSSYDQ